MEKENNNGSWKLSSLPSQKTIALESLFASMLGVEILAIELFGIFLTPILLLLQFLHTIYYIHVHIQTPSWMKRLAFVYDFSIVALFLFVVKKAGKIPRFLSSFFIIF